MIPLVFASLGPVFPAVDPYGVLDTAPVVPRAVPAWHVPQDCVSNIALAQLVPAPARGVPRGAAAVASFHGALGCTRTGAVDVMHTFELLALAREALDTADRIAVADPGEGARRMADVFALGNDFRYGTLVSMSAGVALQQDALAHLVALGPALPAADRSAVVTELERMRAAAPPLTLAQEVIWTDWLLTTTWSPIGWILGAGVIHAARELEPTLASTMEMADAARSCLDAENAAWFSNPGVIGLCDIAGELAESLDARDRSFDRWLAVSGPM